MSGRTRCGLACQHVLVSRVIRFGEEQLVRFARTGMWISLKCFRIEPAGALTLAVAADDQGGC